MAVAISKHERPQHPVIASAVKQADILLVGNPNAGKTTLFNQLTGMRLKTANFPGTTLEVRRGALVIDEFEHHLYDMPGLYSLHAASGEETTALEVIRNTSASGECVIILIVDATNLVRNLFLAGQVLELGAPTVVALNMIDLSRRAGTRIDTEVLARHLGCPVVPLCARSGEGIPQLKAALGEVIVNNRAPEPPLLLRNAERPTHALRYDWAERVVESCVEHAADPFAKRTETIDRVLTHPVSGLAVFASILFLVFYLIFSLADVPMRLIEGAFGGFGGWVGGVLGDGLLSGMLVDGVIAGVGGVLVFLPQICVLFFCISLLEDTGYLARAACLMDRVLRPFGLPGKAFVPMLSAHACAIPAIMSARVIENRNDRLVTILVLPLMTCSARLPVYAMITALLFPASPLQGALVFTGAYALGIGAAVCMAWVFRRAIVRTATAPLMIELPDYKMPSIKTALLAAYDRGFVFVRKAGTVILCISVILWWLMTFPQTEAPADIDTAAASQYTLEHSFAGQLGKTIEPVIAPLGFDWRIGVGIIASFAAREVLVSSLSVIYGAGEDGGEDGGEGGALLDRLHAAKRADGTPVFTLATGISLLVFYVLAMQCLPTQAITRRETGRWAWAGFQWAYMTALAYGASFIAFQSLAAAGFNA